MLELCIETNGVVKLNREYAWDLARMHAEINMTDKGIQINFRSPNYLNEFLNRYSLHKDILVTLESYKSNIGFLHVSGKEFIEGVSVTPQEVSGLKDGLLGRGVYAIGAGHYDYNTPLYEKLREIIIKRQLKENTVPTGTRTSIFTFSGRMKEIVRGKGLEGFFWLDTAAIKQEKIQTIVEETFEIIYE